MKVSAVLNSQCAIVRDWRSRNLSRGLFRSVIFLRDELTYTADDITPEEASRFVGVDFITIEVIGKADMPAPAFTDEELFGGRE